MQQLTGPYTAMVALDTGLNAHWSIKGGTLVPPANGSTVQFQVLSEPFVTLSCTITSEAGPATFDRQMIALPFAPRNYLADFKINFATYRDEIAKEVAKGDSYTYVGTGYYLQGLTAAAEASGDTALMDELVQYTDQMIAHAKPVVRNGVTYQEWYPLDANGNPDQGHTYGSTSPLARVAAIIAGRPEFKARYGAQFDRIVTFVDQSIFKYWFDKKTGVYADLNHSYPIGDNLPAGVIPWLSKDLGGWGDYQYFAQQCLHFGMIATWMYQATGNPLYLDAATRVAQDLKKNHLVATNGHWTWDPWAASEEAACMDTSHANRMAEMMVSMYEAGIVFTASDIDVMAHTFTDVLWNQNITDPMFSNWIDGWPDRPFLNVTEPGGNGLIYHGWDTLGRYSPEVQRVVAISYQIIATHTPQSPPLNASLAANASSAGRVMLSGTLARNIAR